MKQKTTLYAATLAIALLFSPLFAAAETAVSAGVSAGVSGTSVRAKATVELRGKDRAGQELDRRTEKLKALIARVDAMKNLSSSEKTAISGTLTAQVNALSALKAKIDSDTDAATLKSDIASITSSYRIYALIIPQGAIVAAADRILTVAQKMKLISAKFEARATASAAAGHDTAALRAALDDYNQKVNDAAAKAQEAVNAIASLVPDQGDATKQKANADALKTGRATIVAAQADLKAARKDAGVVLSLLKGMNASSEASTKASTGAGTPAQ